MAQLIAKLLKAEYACTLEAAGMYVYSVGVEGVEYGNSGVIASEGPHNIRWQWSVTVGRGPHQYDIETTLVAADDYPVSFKVTATKRNGATEQLGDFQLYGPMESKSVSLGKTESLTYMYKVSFRYPVAEVPAALALAKLLLASRSPLLALQDDWNKLMTDDSFSDVAVTAGSKRFFLHKNVLASRSEVFDRMLKADMREKNSNTIDVDMDENIAEEMFRFIYTGKVEGLEQIAAELIDPAVMYELTDLKRMCLQQLVMNLDDEKAAETLVIVDRYSKNEEGYKDAILKYISRNYFRVVSTDGWRKLTNTNVELSNAVTDHFYDH